MMVGTEDDQAVDRLIDGLIDGVVRLVGPMGDDEMDEFMEAAWAFGQLVRDVLARRSKCGTCGGGGLVPSAGCSCKGGRHTCSPRTCPSCGGSGQR